MEIGCSTTVLPDSCLFSSQFCISNGIHLSTKGKHFQLSFCVFGLKVLNTDVLLQFQV
jgi:hypothetical protein